MEIYKFYKISHDGGLDTKVIIARSRYEAIGFYIMEEVEHINSFELDSIEVLPLDHKISVSCESGILLNRTLNDIFQELDTWIRPCVLINLN